MMRYLAIMALTRFRICLLIITALLSLSFWGAITTLAAGRVSVVSVNQAGTATGNFGSTKPRLSPDGRFIVFVSNADNLVANDNNGREDVFLRDLMSGVTTLVSVDATGLTSANNDSFDAYVSADGRYVFFASAASNLVPNDKNGLPDVFMRDMVTKTTTLVSVNREGTGSANGLTFNAVDLDMTRDGRYVLFLSDASDLVANDTNNAFDLFMRDMVEGKTSLVSVNMSGSAAGLGFIFPPSISDDGRFVTFQSNANDLVPNDQARGGGIETDVFVRDMVAGVTSLISVNRTGTSSGNAPSRFPSSTPDGRFIVFESSASDLVSNDNNVYRDVFIRDRVAGTTTLVSVNKNGATSTNPSNVIGAPVISDGGRFVAFASIADDLAEADTNRRTDVFVRDMSAGTTTMVSRNRAGTNGGNDDSRNPIISADGRFVIFQSLATDLTEKSDTNGVTDIFAYDLRTAATELISVSRTGASGNNVSLEPSISADGRSVAFSSDASDLVANDTNSSPDVFVSEGTRVQFSSDNYSFSEGAGHGEIIVTRTGDLSAPASVDYMTSDQSGLTPCQTTGTRFASDRCDYGTAVGTLRFAAGEQSKVISLPLINDAHVEGLEELNIQIRNPSDMGLGWRIAATVTITDDDTQTATRNPIDDQTFFIRQQYIDFLGREPEPAGFQFWMDRMNNCPSGDVCDRTDTAKRFFESDEFKERGYFIFKLYDVILGRLPLYTEFVPDVARLNGFQTVQEQQQSKAAYLSDFMQKTEFRNLYSTYVNADGSLINGQATSFVDALIAKGGISLPAATRTNLIANLQNGQRTAAQTIEDFILLPEISNVGTRYYDRAIITMQYFGFLRRNPEHEGFDFWWNRLANPQSKFYHNYREIVGNFIQSDEYYFRFSNVLYAP